MQGQNPAHIKRTAVPETRLVASPPFRLKASMMPISARKQMGTAAARSLAGRDGLPERQKVERRRFRSHSWRKEGEKKQSWISGSGKMQIRQWSIPLPRRQGGLRLKSDWQKYRQQRQR